MIYLEIYFGFRDFMEELFIFRNTFEFNLLYLFCHRSEEFIEFLVFNIFKNVFLLKYPKCGGLRFLKY